MSECSPTEASEFLHALLEDQHLLLRKGVAWLNANRHREDSHVVEGWLTREMAALDEVSKLLASGPPAREEIDGWLETAGRVGGPEVEQDPTQSHPRAWHGNPPAAAARSNEGGGFSDDGG